MLCLFGEEVEHGGELGGGDADVATAGDFDVDDLHVEGFGGFDHAAGLGDVDGAVVVAVDDVFGDVADFGEAVGVAAALDGS